MRRARVGLLARDGRLTVVAITGRGRLDHFVAADAEDPAATLAAELHARGFSSGRVRVGLDRRAVVVKAIDLPRAARGDLGEMLAYDLERHVTFAPDDIRFDWVELPGESETARALVAVAERRAVDRPIGLLATAERRPAILTIACHELTTLLPRVLPPHRVVWAHRHGEHADMLFLHGRTLLASRQVSAGDVQALAREISRSFALARWPRADSVWLSGDDGEGWRAELASELGIPVEAPPYAEHRAPLVDALPATDRGDALLALAVAAGSRTPPLNLLPVEARPWVPSREQLVTAGLVAITALLGLSLALTHTIKVERYVARLAQEIRRLEPEAKAVEGLTTELARKRRVLSALRSAEDERIRALPVLHELTETLPAGAWLQALTMDRQGVELTGQADAASTLIPLLEASPRLERVEFTSPVTKTQGKEQFRIRAAWEPPQPRKSR